MEARTIAAISSAVNTAGIGIVRMSGPRAFEVLGRVFRSPSGKDILSVPSHTVHYGYIHRDGEICDEVLVIVMRAPHTYTREDTVEIDCHGGILSMKKVLDALLAAGAKAAEPGEFTKKAFFNGRIDLSQAEAVMDVIESTSEMALKNSLGQLSGLLRTRVERMRETILHEVARIEAALDDPEHLSLDGYPEEISPKLEEMAGQMDRLLASFDNGRLVKEGIRTAIIGKPNVGKSSLLNLLLGQERAIVTQVPGTTRDVLEDTVRMGNITLRLSDTAGIRKTQDVVEQIGVQKARELARDCDLILYVVDSSVPLDENDEDILGILKDRQVIVVYNKTDLPPVWDKEEMARMASCPVVPLSAREGNGLEKLEEEISSAFFSGRVASREELYLTNARHKELLEDARAAIGRVQESLSLGMPEDFWTIDLMDAYESLGKILGEALDEDLVDEIFKSFCMGK